MILSDREIEALLDDGAISIKPRPDKSLWTSTCRHSAGIRDIQVSYGAAKATKGTLNVPLG
jgi:deoxycytidine triphosphate deaminase